MSKFLHGPPKFSRGPPVGDRWPRGTEVKSTVHPRTGHEGTERGSTGIALTLSLTSALDRGWMVNSTPRPLYLQE
jgi:hypothetical protein